MSQGDPNMIHLHKELQDHGQDNAKLATIMTQLAKAQLQQTQALERFMQWRLFMS